jgi:DNA-binding response OmpR family regulator
LNCEDDQDVAMLLSMMLQQHGYSCDIAGDTAAARDLLRTQRYAGMTLDLLLPGQDGLAFIRELRADEQTRDLPVVVVSASADQRRAQLNGDGFGIIDWLTKPIDPARLDAAIAQAVRPTGVAPARILHLEDDPDLRQIIAALLGPEAELVAAADLHQARQQLATQRFDLVLLDVSLPDGSGLDLLPWLQQQAGAPTPVIIFSVQEMSNDIARQVAATLVKSRTSNHQLITTIKALVSHARPNAAIPSTLEV